MKIYKGLCGSEGLTKGKIFYLKKDAFKTAVNDIEDAIRLTEDKIDNLYNETVKKSGIKNAKIFSAYKMILNDDFFILPIKRDINIGINPIEAVKKNTTVFYKALSNNNDEYLKERANDIIYLSNMLIDALCGENEIVLKEKCIIVADDLSPAETITLDEKMVAGIVTLKGGVTSHTVILAKSMDIPAIVGIKEFEEKFAGKYGYLNATEGELVLDLDSKETEKYEMLLREEEKTKHFIKEYSKAECETKDKEKIEIYGNIGSPKEIDNSLFFNGIGLFRTEFLFSSKKERPSLEEQIESYKKVSSLVGDKTVTIRVLDIGGDKNIPFINFKQEENPFLGNRGIRLLLGDKTELFYEQIEAILIAFKNKSVNILIPMVSVMEELFKAKEIIGNVKRNLKQKGIDFCENVKIGIMIETPASAINSDLFAKECDFFSIGTNDLTQYIMAADRGNEDVAHLYYNYNPAILRLIKYVIGVGNKNNIPVSICGNIASDFSMTQALIGLGLKKFSVPFKSINKLKYIISKISIPEAENVANNLLNCNLKEKGKEIILGNMELL